MTRRVVLISILMFVVLGADQATKLWARGALRGQPALTIVPNYLLLEYHENPGMAFGLGRNLPAGRFILIAVGVIVLAFVWRLVRQVERRKRTADVAFALVAGGAIGNVIDRVWLGRVVDFIVMHWRHRYVWPAYNVADIALCVGVGLLLIAIGVTQPKQLEQQAQRRKSASGDPASTRARRAAKGRRRNKR